MQIVPFKEWLNEAVSAENTSRALDLVTSFLSKKLKSKVVRIPGLEQFKNSLEVGFGVRYIYDKDKSIRLNWSTAKTGSSSLKSVDIWDGTKSDPVLHIAFDGDFSLVKMLPSIVDTLQNPIMGQQWMVPIEPVNEATQIGWDESIDAIKDTLHSVTDPVNPAYFDSKFGWRAHSIFSALVKNYPDKFTKAGRGYTWSGTEAASEFLDSKRADLYSLLGAVKATVSKGPTGEKYAETQAEKEIEAQGGAEKIAYEDQLEDLRKLVKLITKGASHALFIAGRGGCICLNSLINLYSSSPVEPVAS